jgi:hypothetical protein
MEAHVLAARLARGEGERRHGELVRPGTDDAAGDLDGQRARIGEGELADLLRADLDLAEVEGVLSQRRH